MNGHHSNGINGVYGIESLSKELPVVLNDLVPLSLVVERIIGQAYAELANLAEILPSTRDAERKAAIVDYVLQTRRQILKLLVLVRWSKEAENVAKCMNIVGFLSEQNYEFDHSINSLTEIKLMLQGARVRNYDLTTAITVLSTGNYRALPSVIEETFSAPATLPDEVALRTLREMDEVLRYRLALVERLHRRMKKYSIADGRATFRVEGLWEVSMAFGGENDDENAEWYLLSIKFLFQVKDVRGVWSSVPLGPMKDHLIGLCNQELVKRPVKIDQEDSTNEKDAPLIRGYNFLQRLTLGYQIESLYLQASQLVATSWAGNLKIELSKDRRRLRIEYWIDIRPESKSTSTKPALPPASAPTAGELIISFETSTVKESRAQIPNGAARNHTFETMFDAEVETESAEEKLSLVWIPSDAAMEQRAGLQLILDENLNVETLLTQITSAHAKFATLELFFVLQKDVNGLNADALTLDASIGAVPFIRVHLLAQHYIQVSIDPFSGRLEFKALGEVSTTREARLRAVAEKANESRKLVGESLLRIKASTIMDEAESRAVYLGYTTTKRLQLRQSDLARFGAVRFSLFIQLSKSTSVKSPLSFAYHLALLLSDEGFRFALISVKFDTELVSNTLVMEDLGWLNKVPSHFALLPKESAWGVAVNGRPMSFGFDLTLEDLRDLYDYSLRRISYFQIEQQLFLRRIPFKSVAPEPIPSAENTLLMASPPYLVVQSADLLRGKSRVAFPNIAIQCVQHNKSIRVTFHVRFRDFAFTNQSQLSPNLIFDPKTCTVTFLSEEIDTCLLTFLSAFSIIVQSITLNNHNRTEKKMKKVISSSSDSLTT